MAHGDRTNQEPRRSHSIYQSSPQIVLSHGKMTPTVPLKSAKKKHQVLTIIFPGFNTLDLSGPLDVFTKLDTSDFLHADIAAEDESP